MIGSCAVLVMCAGVLLAFVGFGSSGCFLASWGCFSFLTNSIDPWYFPDPHKESLETQLYFTW